mgnify:CR=1 FL=1
MSAAANNMNRWWHGLRSARLGRDQQYIENGTLRFRRQLENAVAAKHGEVAVRASILAMVKAADGGEIE